MSIFKCKMCGGTLEISENQTTAVCDYCGTEQTLPKLNDEKIANLYERANSFRRNKEFDKAMSIYEEILREDGTDSEVYWSLVLCHYGIEYVEDPASHKRIPTVNRAQFTSIFDDDNYKSALQHADMLQRAIYEAEAKAINEIQKGILAIAQNEEPFDVFICYKETDENGRRTQDSVLANDLYYQLTNEGFKVFFSRITLEDKLGVAYEPYIFAALNSAKVMVAIGTKPEYFNAVWVKNEWSRYLALVKQSGGKKVLIPAYRGMDPYELPEEFSHLQAQDMSKLGFMQDLIRGIKKLTEADKPKVVKETVKETVVVNGGNSNVAPLLKRVFMYLEDRDWAAANEYCEKVLDIDPENAEAYLGKLLASLNCNKKEKLANLKNSFEPHPMYKKILRFGSEPLKNELKKYITHINQRNEQQRIESIYSSALAEMKNARTEKDYISAAEDFKSIPNYRDSKKLYDECLEKAEIAKKDAIYALACEKQKIDGLAYENALNQLAEAEQLFIQISNWRDSSQKAVEVKSRTKDLIYEAACSKQSTAKNNMLEKAIELFSSIKEWRDSEQRIVECQNQIEENNLIAKKKQKHRRKVAIRIGITAIIAFILVCALVLFGIGACTVSMFTAENEGIKLMEQQKYDEALDKFMWGFASDETIIDCINKAIPYYVDNNQFDKLVDMYNDVKDKELIISVPEEYCEKYYQGMLNQQAPQTAQTLTELGEKLVPLGWLPDTYTNEAAMLNFYRLWQKRATDTTDKDFVKSNLNELRPIFSSDETIKSILLTDDLIGIFMLGEWQTEDNEYYLKFYEKDESSSSVWSSYNLPYPRVTHDHYDILDLTYVFEDEGSVNTVNVYKFEFVNADTVNVYCYEDENTYTLTRK